MKKFNWDVTAFDFSDTHRGSHRLQVEEAEDKVSEAIMLVKQARAGNLPEPTDDILAEVITDLSTVVDKMRKVRSDLKNL